MIPNDYMDQIKVLSADQVKQVVGKGSKWVDTIQVGLPALIIFGT